MKRTRSTFGITRIQKMPHLRESVQINNYRPFHKGKKKKKESKESEEGNIIWYFLECRSVSISRLRSNFGLSSHLSSLEICQVGYEELIRGSTWCKNELSVHVVLRSAPPHQVYRNTVSRSGRAYIVQYSCKFLPLWQRDSSKFPLFDKPAFLVAWPVA